MKIDSIYQKIKIVLFNFILYLYCEYLFFIIISLNKNYFLKSKIIKPSQIIGLVSSLVSIQYIVVSIFFKKKDILLEK